MNCRPISTSTRERLVNSRYSCTNSVSKPACRMNEALFRSPRSVLLSSNTPRSYQNLELLKAPVQRIVRQTCVGLSASEDQKIQNTVTSHVSDGYIWFRLRFMWKFAWPTTTQEKKSEQNLTYALEHRLTAFLFPVNKFGQSCTGS
jgi:hypothetical protein